MSGASQRASGVVGDAGPARAARAVCAASMLAWMQARSVWPSTTTRKGTSVSAL